MSTPQHNRRSSTSGVSLAKVTDSDDFGTDPARNWTVNDRLRARRIGMSGWLLGRNDLDSLADWFAINLAQARRIARH